MRGINYQYHRTLPSVKQLRWRHAVVVAVPLLLLSGAAFGQDAPVRVTPSEAQQAVVEKVKPVYPEMARRMKLVGRVELEAVVDEQGRVESVEVKSGNPILRMAARDALKQWKFKPFTRDGRPVKAIVPVAFEFQPEA